eukprot:68705-Pleurochrysis_carterae.AAC.1
MDGLKQQANITEAVSLARHTLENKKLPRTTSTGVRRSAVSIRQLIYTAPPEQGVCLKAVRKKTILCCRQLYASREWTAQSFQQPKYSDTDSIPCGYPALLYLWSPMFQICLCLA